MQYFYLKIFNLVKIFAQHLGKNSNTKSNRQEAQKQAPKIFTYDSLHLQLLSLLCFYYNTKLFDTQ
jgi:hypothetical protein